MTETALPVERTTTPRVRPDEAALGFGRHFSDHMVVADWERQGGWRDARVVPYAPLELDPAAAVLHYGEALFEGLKAIRTAAGRVNLFRPDAHAARMARGAPRLCMPAPPEELLVGAMCELVRADLDWVPSAPGTAYYVRPTLVATEAFLGVRPADTYRLFVIGGPVGSYYEGGTMQPVRIWVETEHTRAAPGGLGAVKTGANYAASLHAAARAREHGYDQVLWLNAGTKERLEEVGTMNVVAVLGDELVTPPLSDSILAGITRDCVLALARDAGMAVSERPLPLDELVAGARDGTLRELFGTGTAAVISPIGELGLEGGERVAVGEGGVGPVAQRLYDELTGIQRGERPDRHGWLHPVA